MSLFADIHIIQSVPSSCCVRDNAGNPKTQIVGQTERMALTSQSLKHSMKLAFGADAGSVLTKDPRGMIMEEIVSQAQELDIELSHDEVRELAEASMAAADSKFVQKEQSKGYFTEDGTSLDALFNFETGQAARLAAIALAVKTKGLTWDSKSAEISACKFPELVGKKPHKAAPDVLYHKDGSCPVSAWWGLFGAFSTALPNAKTMGAFRVADAFGIEANVRQYDFLTGVDMRRPEDWPGTAMVDEQVFQTGTVYKYACLMVDLLVRNMKDAELAASTTEVLLRNWIPCLPQGKVTSHAQYTWPAAVVVHLHDRVPSSLADAFNKPVYAREGKGVAELGCEKLATWMKDTLPKRCMDGAHGARVFVLALNEDGKALESVATPGDVFVDADALAKELANVVRERGKDMSDVR